MKTIYVVKHKDAQEQPVQKYKISGESMEAEVSIKTKDPKEQYINKHGYHFTEELAEYASKKMVNDNGSQHMWNVTDVKNALTNLGYKKPAGSTLADITYTANMCYADFYSSVIPSEETCITYAVNVANDKDGYEGIQFCRWLADVEHKHIEIDWNKFI